MEAAYQQYGGGPGGGGGGREVVVENVTKPETMAEMSRRGEVGANGKCSPPHPMHFEPLFLEVNGII